MAQLLGATGQELCSLELPSPPPRAKAGFLGTPSAKVPGLQGNGENRGSSFWGGLVVG